MIRKEKRIVVVTYCDYCGAEITHIAHSSVTTKRGTYDFCSTYERDTIKTCLEKYKEEVRAGSFKSKFK